MKAAILVCVMAAAASAAPRYTRSTPLDATLSEHVRAAEQAWAAAEREQDVQKQPARWEQAAAAFAEVDRDPIDPKVKREAAYAAVLAWKNALGPTSKPLASAHDAAPQQLPARELALIAAIDRYASYATDPNDPELPGLLFIKAQTYARFAQTDTAIPIWRAIVDRYPQQSVAEYAANLVLDAYNRRREYDHLTAFAAELAKNDQLVRTHPDLADVVRKIEGQAKRKHVEELEAAAGEAHDVDKYTAVGTAYLELYNADPSAAQGDELLYNAGVAFEEGRSIAAAIQAFELLQRQYPRSKIVARALARVARIYQSLAMYDRAADKLEQYAKKYAGEKDAFDALSDAVLDRKAIGDRDAAIADTEYFIKMFGAKRPREAADAMWSLTALYEAEPDRALAQLREYLRSYAAKGDAARVVIAHAKIGQLLWKQSCPLAGIDGLCVKDNAGSRTCGTGVVRTSTVTTRHPGKRAEALAAFAAAIKEYERQPASADPGARYFYGQAKLAAADDALETNLALGVPTGLSFNPTNPAARNASVKRFGQWLEQRQATGASVSRAYEAVLSIKDAATSITAVSRIGILAQSFATSLVTSELPRDVRTGAHAADKVRAYCDQMTEVAAPLEAHAVEVFATCLAKSSELSWFSDSSALCERELIRTRPAQFPPARELRATPLLASPVIAGEPVP